MKLYIEILNSFATQILCHKIVFLYYKTLHSKCFNEVNLDVDAFESMW